MNEFVNRYLNKLCIIYTMNGDSSAVTGTITEIDGNWLVVQPESPKDVVGTELINLEYVVRIKEYPMKNGKKAGLF